ncbi:MarR family transcriptional regulator [Rhodobacterales bacterium HKCCE3408]|nr:MarR family transcriptional regulator [Rhodobacterales bacterium HKCCE3408]
MDDAALSRADLFETFNEFGIITQLATSLLSSVLPDGIHPSHFSILNHLVRTGDGKTPVRIAAAMQVTKTTMTHSIRVLESGGYIEVRANPDDGRGKLVFLTDAGRAFREKAIAAVTTTFEEIVTPEIAQRLARIRPDLVAIRRHLDSNRR